MTSLQPTLIVAILALAALSALVVHYLLYKLLRRSARRESARTTQAISAGRLLPSGSC